MNKILSGVLILLLLMPIVAGLGVSPGKRTFDFEPGKEKEVEVTIYNNDKKNISCMIEVRGELKNYINLSDKKIHFRKGDNKKSFTYTINYPEKFSEPGIHNAEIVVKELLKDHDGNVVIKPNLMVISKLHVKVPYPHKYAKGQLMLENVKRGENLEVFIRFSNVGSEMIKNAQASVDIMSPDGEIIDKLKSDSVSVEPKGFRELTAELDTTNLKPGKYIIDASVKYDKKKINLSGSFKVEDFMIKLLSVAVDSFSLGGIADFEVTVKNIGNRLVNDFNAGLFLKDKKGEPVADLDSYKIELSPGDVKETKIYWDTEKISAGDYFGELSLNYDDKRLVKDIKTILKEDEMEVKVGDEITGMAVSEEDNYSVEPPGDSWLNLPLVVVIILLLAIVVLQLYRIKNNSGK